MEQEFITLDQILGQHGYILVDTCSSTRESSGFSRSENEDKRFSHVEAKLA